jgi:hypothetical protein
MGVRLCTLVGKYASLKKPNKIRAEKGFFTKRGHKCPSEIVLVANSIIVSLTSAFCAATIVRRRQHAMEGAGVDPALIDRFVTFYRRCVIFYDIIGFIIG